MYGEVVDEVEQAIGSFRAVRPLARLCLARFTY